MIFNVKIMMVWLLFGTIALAQRTDPTPLRGRMEAGAPLTPSDLPTNYDFQTGHGTTGSVLSTEKTGSGSATRALLRAFGDVAQFFAGRPTPLSGIRDQEDQSAQILFQATREGQSVRGLAIATCNPTRNSIAIHFLFDQESRFPNTLPRLVQFIQPQSDQPKSASLNWRWTQLPDGSGKLKLPDGWRITGCVNSMVDAQGPHGKVALGINVPIRTPNDYMAQNFGYALVAPFTDPVTAYKNIAPQYIRNAYQASGQMPPEVEVEILEAGPIQYQGNMQSVILISDETLTYANGQTSVTREMINIIVFPTDMTQWVFYFSAVATTPAQFASSLPVLLEIWRSWKIDDRVFQQRLDQAVRDLNEANRIFQEGMQAQSQAMDRVMDNWSERMREYQYMRDTESDQLYQVNLHQSQALVDALNREAGYQQYEVIPLREFNQRY